MVLYCQAEVAKTMGNRLLKGGKLEAAEESYTEAIALDPGQYTFYTNRSIVRMRLHNEQVDD